MKKEELEDLYDEDQVTKILALLGYLDISLEDVDKDDIYVDTENTERNCEVYVYGADKYLVLDGIDEDNLIYDAREEFGDDAMDRIPEDLQDYFDYEQYSIDTINDLEDLYEDVDSASLENYTIVKL